MPRHAPPMVAELMAEALLCDGIDLGDERAIIRSLKERDFRDPEIDAHFNTVIHLARAGRHCTAEVA